LKNPSFVIKAEDTGDTAELDTQQKEQLADAISDISDYLLFDGAVSASREAAYPFYRLDFGEYGMVVTTDNRLLVLMDSDTAYDYGIGREGMAVKFVTPNIEFIEKIQFFLPAKHNTSKDSLNYLMNAKKLIFAGDYSNGKEFTEQFLINKCVRAIKEAVGEEISSESVDKNIEEKNTYNFFIGGDSTDNMITVTHTDKYIEYNGKYYEPLIPPGHLMGNLFAGYF
jgi:hypothetical protein